HLLPGPGAAAALPGRDQRDRAALPVRPLRLRLQGWSARGQPLRHGRRGARAPAGAGAADPVAGRAAHLLPRDLTARAGAALLVVAGVAGIVTRVAFHRSTLGA